jgi:hypothetical protein
MRSVIRPQPRPFPTSVTTNLLPLTNSPQCPSTEPPPRVESNEPPQPTSAHRYPLRSSPAAPICSKPTSPRLPVSAPTPAAATHRYPLRSTQHSANSATSDLFAHVHQANTVVNPTTGQVQEYRHLLQGPDAPTWTHSFANELGRLSQGVGTLVPSGTETIWWIRKHQVPSDRKVTYGRIVATIRPQKSEPHRTRLTVGGDRMRFSWLQCRERQRQFIIYWRPGSENLGDYHTKHHSASHHRKMRPQFLQPTKTTQPISRKTFTPCEGVLMQPFTDAQQTHYVPQTNCLWSNESRTQKLLHSLGKATRRLANSSLSY